MGFDLYGISPSGVDIHEPSSDASKEEWSTYFETVNRIDGAYFRSNVWGWRPLWGLITEICDDILTDDDVERGTYNDGLEISSKKCELISKRLKDAIDDGGVSHFIEAFNDMKKQAPKETCSICEGTGTRKGWEGWQSKKEWLKHHDRLEYGDDKDSVESLVKSMDKEASPQVGYKWAKECKGCNACHGAGKVNAFFCHYDIDENEVKRFLNFCENSGGFNIW